jgi:hypothetical protein
MNQTDIAHELKTTRQTIMKAIHELNQWTKKGLYDLAKQSMATMLFTSINGQNEIEKDLWRIINEKDEKKVNYWHKLHAYRLLMELHKSKFDMYASGPAVMEVNKLKNRIDILKQTMEFNIEHNHNNNNNNKVFNPSFKTKRKVSFVIDEDSMKREELEKLGIPYEVSMIDEEEEDD